MNLLQVQTALNVQQDAFQQTALQPNTLERNIVLAGYRTEIARLQKLAAKFLTAKKN